VARFQYLRPTIGGLQYSVGGHLPLGNRPGLLRTARVLPTGWVPSLAVIGVGLRQLGITPVLAGGEGGFEVTAWRSAAWPSVGPSATPDPRWVGVRFRPPL